MNQRSVSFLADASDNLTIDRVAFYQADALLGIDRDWPYGIEAAVEGVGEVVFRAVAFDQVGNRAESVVVVLVEGA